MPESLRVPYDPVTDSSKVRSTLETLSVSPRITLRQLSNAVADVFASGSPQDWRQTDERWLKGRSRMLVVGYDPSSGERFDETWVQPVYPDRSYGSTYHLRMYKDRMRAYQRGVNLESVGREVGIDQSTRKELVLDLLHGVDQPSPDPSRFIPLQSGYMNIQM